MSHAYSEDQLVQQTTAAYLHQALGWEAVYAHNEETFGPDGLLGRTDERQAVLTRYLLAALRRLNPGRPETAYQQALAALCSDDAAKTLLQINAEKYALQRQGVPVSYRTSQGQERSERLRVFDFEQPHNNHFLAVRELWLRGPIYRRRPDIVGFVNGLPLLFVELKKHHKDLRLAYEQNLSDYRDTIPHLFHHNAFLVLANGLRGRIGSLTSKYAHFGEWKRLAEGEPGQVDFQTLLNGVCAKAALMDLFENFILFDHSKAEARKIIARNHQYLGVNQAFAAVQAREVREGRLGVFWHTQGAGKSYSMAFLARKVHRKLAGDFTFLLLTDRLELDRQLYKTFAGIGEVSQGEQCRATSGPHLQELLAENHRYIFSLIHKFNLEDQQPYSQRANLIVLSDEAHRSQYGLFARRMRQALPNAAYLGFTGTPLLGAPEDQLTRQVFGEYVSVYDFQRAVQDGATVPLYYDNRGEKLGITTESLNARVAEALDSYADELDAEKEARLRRALSQEYAVLTAPARLERLAEDFVAHYTRRWQSGKAMLVCLDKLTAVRMHGLIEKHWQRAITDCRRQIERAQDVQEQADLESYLDWLQSTQRLVIVSEEQNEVKTFQEWGLDILPHRQVMRDPQRDLEEEFKQDAHPFRLAIVCAMWLTGFDVEALATLYVDKPMQMHTLMQTIARANRVKEGKPNGLIVDYNGLVKSLRQALAVYAGGAGAESDPLPPVEQLFQQYEQAMQACTQYLIELDFELDGLIAAQGFDKLAQIQRGVDAICLNDETRARFRAQARQALALAQTLLSEKRLYWPVYRHRHQAIEALYQAVEQERIPEEVAHILRAAYREVGSSIRLYADQLPLPGGDSGKLFDISRLNLERLRQEFEVTTSRHAVFQTLKRRVETRLEQMLRRNPARAGFAERFQQIVEEYNRETERAYIEKVFEKLLNLIEGLSDEEQRSVREGLDEDSLAVFDLLCERKNDLSAPARRRVKQVANELIEKVKAEIRKLDNWRAKTATQAQVRALIYDYLYDEQTGLPLEAYTPEDVHSLAEDLFQHVYVQYPDAVETVY